MVGPGDELAAGAGGHSHLRASHADREQVIGTLKAAFAHGRLDRDEFGLRVGHALASRTRADLAVLTADLPASEAGSRPPELAGGPGNKKAVAALSCATVALVVMWPIGRMTPDGLAVPLTVAFALWLAAVLMGWPVLFLIWLDKRAGSAHLTHSA